MASGRRQRWDTRPEPCVGRHDTSGRTFHIGSSLIRPLPLPQAAGSIGRPTAAEPGNASTVVTSVRHGSTRRMPDTLSRDRLTVYREMEESRKRAMATELAAGIRRHEWPLDATHGGGFYQHDKNLFAILSNGELWTRSPGQTVWQRILPEVSGVQAMAASD